MKKGYGMALIYNMTGRPRYYTVDLNWQTFNLSVGDKQMRMYNVKKSCIYFNEFDIPTIAYRSYDADPIDPRTGLETVTDPLLQQATLAKLNQAEAAYNPALEWLKKNWVTIGIGIIIFVGIFAFVLVHQTDTIAQLTAELGKTAVVNAPTTPTK